MFNWAKWNICMKVYEEQGAVYLIIKFSLDLRKIFCIIAHAG